MTRFRSTSPESTEEWGCRLAAGLPTRTDASTVIYLNGDLGAGKTTLAKGLIRGFGIDDIVRSPTYALIEPYEAQGFTVVHLDLYRLRDPSELEALGLRDWAGPGNVWIVEWPQKGGSRLPAADLEIDLTAAADSHALDATARTAFGRTWLARLEDPAT